MKPSNILYCLLAVCLLLGLPAWGQTPPMEYEYEFGITQLSPHYVTDSTTMEEFVYYTCADLDLTSQVGAPTLPVKYVRFSVPYNADNISLSVDASYSDLSTYGKRIYPVQEPIPTGERSGNQSFALDSAIYYGNAYWPSSVAEIVSDGFYLGDNRVITVAIYPLQYKAKNGNLRLYSYIDLGINYTIGATPGNILVRQDATLRQQEMNQVKTLVENPENVESFSTEANIAQLAPVQGDPQPQAQYLIIAPDSLASSFKRLAAFKRQKGYSVDVVTVEQIVNDPMYANGDVSLKANQDTISAINDPAGKIRQYLKDAHNNRGTQYVLLGGKDVPFRYILDEYNAPVPTDIYYSNLTGIFSLVNDSVCYKIMNSDIFCPTLYVGRILCQVNDEIDNYTNKLLIYELNPGKGDNSYLQSAVYLQTDWLQTRSYAQQAATQFLSLFPDTTIIEERSVLNPTGSGTIQQLNANHFGYLNLNTHGAPSYLLVNRLPLPNGDLKTWGNANQPYVIKPTEDVVTGVRTEVGNSIECLTNKYYPFVCFSIACSTMPFDNYGHNNFSGYTIGEALTLMKDRGAVAYLANTRDGHPSSFNVEKAFQNEFLEGVYKLGVAESNSKFKARGAGYHDRITHNLLGDSEFEMWTNIPSVYTSPSVSRTDNTLTVSGIPSGDTTTVAISNGTTQRWLKLTNGSAVFQNVNPNSTIMLYRHNYLPWIAPLVLQNERVTDDRYIIASDVTAGRIVDANRTAGDFVIATGTTYEIEHKGTVSLQPGFKVEKGATFSVKPSDY